MKQHREDAESTQFHCERCRYDLRGLPSGRDVTCPECGHVNADVDGWTIVGRLHCLKCRLNLHGCTGPVVICPECGRRNNLRIAAVYAYRELPMKVVRRTELFVVGCALAPMVYGLLRFFIVKFGDPGEPDDAAALVLGFALLAWPVPVVSFADSCRRLSFGLLLALLTHLGIVCSVEILIALSPPIRPWLVLSWSVGAVFMFYWAYTLHRKGVRDRMYEPSVQGYRLPLRRYEKDQP